MRAVHGPGVERSETPDDQRIAWDAQRIPVYEPDRRSAHSDLGLCQRCQHLMAVTFRVGGDEQRRTHCGFFRVNRVPDRPVVDCNGFWPLGLMNLDEMKALAVRIEARAQTDGRYL